MRSIKLAEPLRWDHGLHEDGVHASAQRILLILGHPDPAGGHLCHALAQAYAEGAIATGLEVQSIDVAQVDFPLLRTQADWTEQPVPESLKPSQEAIAWAQHLVFFFPLWIGDMPALLKGYFEQVARPGFAFDKSQGGPLGQKALGGRSARVVVTKGMPALVYRHYFRAHSVKSLERNVVGFVGIPPIHATLVGSVFSYNLIQIRQLNCRRMDRRRRCSVHEPTTQPQRPSGRLGHRRSVHQAAALPDRCGSASGRSA